MASKNSIPLFSKAAREVLNHSEFTLLGSGGHDEDTATSNPNTGIKTDKDSDQTRNESFMYIVCL